MFFWEVSKNCNTYGLLLLNGLNGLTGKILGFLWWWSGQVMFESLWPTVRASLHFSQCSTLQSTLKATSKCRWQSMAPRCSSKSSPIRREWRSNTRCRSNGSNISRDYSREVSIIMAAVHISRVHREDPSQHYQLQNKKQETNGGRDNLGTITTKWKCTKGGKKNAGRTHAQNFWIIQRQNLSTQDSNQVFMTKQFSIYT